MAEHRVSAGRVLGWRLTIGGVTLHIHRLNDGSRLIDAADVAALLMACANGMVKPHEAEAAAGFIKEMPLQARHIAV